MEIRDTLELLRILHILTQNYTGGNEVATLANKKIIEILDTL